MTFGINQSERNNVAVRFRDRNDIGKSGKNGLRFVGSYPQITGQSPKPPRPERPSGLEAAGATHLAKQKDTHQKVGVFLLVEMTGC